MTSSEHRRSRRAFLSVALAAACAPLAGCGNHVARTRFPGQLKDFELIPDLPFRTRRIGPKDGPRVILLHELPGLTRDDLALARALAGRKFNVYVPVLFGSEEQDNTLKGYKQSCGSGLFTCSDLSARSPILDTLAPFCTAVASGAPRGVAVIGMCLTGIFPLALLQHGVSAAVLCQPTIPFSTIPGHATGPQVTDLGLSAGDLDDAVHKSPVPFLLVHYAGDPRCPPGRVNVLRTTFDQRVAAIDLPGQHHSSLAGDFDQTAFDDVVTYLSVRLGIATGPANMQLARLGVAECRCRIDADGLWHSI